METLTALLQQISPVDETYRIICQRHWDAVAKPLGGLGHLETLLCQIGSIQRTEQISLTKKAVVVLCVLIVQSQRFISLIKGVRSRDKT